MRKDAKLKVAFTFMCLAVFGVSSHVVAGDFTEGMDYDDTSNKILVSSAVHTDNGVGSMACEGLPVKEKKDEKIIASAEGINTFSGSVYDEGISYESVKALYLAKLRDKALQARPAAGKSQRRSEK